MLYLGVDLGGTNIKAALVNSEGEILCEANTPTNLPRPAEAVCDDIAALCLQLAEGKDVAGVGVGCPGTVDGGTVLYSNNLDWHDFAMEEYLAQKTGLPIAVGNDANVAALGEAHATLFYQGKTAFDFNSGFMIGGVQNNTPEIAQYVRCAPLPRITDSDPIYSAEASHIPLVVWKNAKHPEICKAFIEYLYDTDNYVEFIHSVPVGMLPSLKDIATNSDYLNNDTIKEYSDCVDVIQTAVDEGHAIGFEHGPSAQASYLTSQGVIEEMFQDIITNGTDVETAAKAAEDKLNDIFDTMIS